MVESLSPLLHRWQNRFWGRFSQVSEWGGAGFQPSAEQRLPCHGLSGGSADQSPQERWHWPSVMLQGSLMLWAPWLLSCPWRSTCSCASAPFSIWRACECRVRRHTCLQVANTGHILVVKGWKMQENEGHRRPSSGRGGGHSFVSVAFYFLNISKEDKQKRQRWVGRGKLDLLFYWEPILKNLVPGCSEIITVI